jgi:hypothetical protein
MNTVGKILVILNFLFAIVIGALLVMDVALRNQWKEAYFALKNETTVLKTGRDADGNANRAVANDLQHSKMDLDAQRQQNAQNSKEFKNLEGGYTAEIANLTEKLLDKDRTLAETAKAHARAVEEINLQAKTIRSRESQIAKMEQDQKVLRATAQDMQAKFQVAQQRNEGLLEQLRLLTLAQAKDKAGVNQAAIVIRNPNEPNPPPVKVDGKVEKVEGDLVLISLGTDHQVNKDNTLDIYRLQPDSKYLGMIRIVDANTHKSVARLIPSSGAASRPVLREGDLVTSKLTK